MGVSRRSLAAGLAFLASVDPHKAFAGSSEQAPENSAGDFKSLETNLIARFAPRARVDIVDAIVRRWPVAVAAGISTPRRVQNFFAQIATETGGLSLLEENLNYSAERILVVFKKRVSPDMATKLAHNRIALANHVYNNRLGNDPPMDGWSYRGSGLMQLTGRYNFSKRGSEVGMPFEEKPELVRSAVPAFESAVAYWKARKINDPADQNDLKEVRRRVNGGTIGLPEARIWLARARRVFLIAGPGSAQVSNAEENAAIRAQLSDLNFLKIDPNAAPDPKQVENALKEFQSSRGLEASGVVDDDTLYELTSPDNFKAEE